MATFRFVVLRHELPPNLGRANHWDLMLEQADRVDAGPDDACLLTFEVLAAPETWCGMMKVRRLQDHRRYYLNYQGPISGDRGVVTRVTAGTFVWLNASPNRIQVEIMECDGGLVGVMELKKLSEQSESDSWEMWLVPQDRVAPGRCDLP